MNSKIQGVNGSGRSVHGRRSIGTMALLGVLGLGGLGGTMLALGAGRVQPASTSPAGDADALRLQFSRQMVVESAPPIGSVLAYWGSKAEIDKLEHYELCDGKQVSKLGSPLFGKDKPMLMDRFVMGYGGAEDLRKTKVEGGSNTTPAQPLGSTNPHTLTDAEMPNHSHPHSHFVVSQAQSDEAYKDGNSKEIISDVKKAIAARGEIGGDHEYTLAAAGTHPANAGRTSEDRTTAGGGKPHVHDLPSVPEHENTPAYLGLYYIIRVK